MSPSSRSAAPSFIVLAEDDQDVRDSLTVLLELAGYVVKPLTSGKELLEVTVDMTASGCPPALLISDHRMPEMTGLEALEALGDRSVAPPAVLITAFGDTDVMDKAEQMAVRVVHKPFTADDLLQSLDDVMSETEDTPRACSACGERTGLRARGAALFCQSCRHIADTSDPDDIMLDLGTGD